MKFAIDQNNAGRFYWHLVGDDGSDLAVAATTHKSKKDARAAAIRAQVAAAAASEIRY